MKKYLFAISTAALLIAACAKESQIDNPVKNTPEGRVYTLSAKAPATKAELDETTGAFQWSTGDQIAVYDKKQSKYQIFTTNDSGSSATFTFTATDELDHDFTGSAAYYPVSCLNETQTEFLIPTSVGSAAEVPMQATNTGGALTFDYSAAIVKLTIENVPSFAMSVDFKNSGHSYATDAVHTTCEDMTFYLVVGESTSRASSIILYDTANNEIINKSFTLNYDIVNGALIPLKTAVGPVIDIKKLATSWGDLRIYLYEDDGEYDTAWGNLASVMKHYTDSESAHHYYRILPVDALGNTYDIIVFNASDEELRIKSTITISSENCMTASQKEGLRTIGDSSERFIIRDEAMGINGYDDPDTYLYIKSLTDTNGDDVDGGNGITGGWESASTKAIGWFNATRNGSKTGRYYYFNTDALKNYHGYQFVYEYTMYAKGKTGEDANRWRGEYNKSLTGLVYANYTHLGYYEYYDDGNVWHSAWYIDNDFDKQISE